MHYFQITYNLSYEFVNLAPIGKNPIISNRPLETVTHKVDTLKLKFYPFKELPTISDMIQKFNSEREKYKSKNSELLKIEVVSFSELSKEHFEILTRKPNMTQEEY